MIHWFLWRRNKKKDKEKGVLFFFFFSYTGSFPRCLQKLVLCQAEGYLPCVRDPSTWSITAASPAVPQQVVTVRTTAPGLQPRQSNMECGFPYYYLVQAFPFWNTFFMLFLNCYFSFFSRNSNFLSYSITDISFFLHWNLVFHFKMVKFQFSLFSCIILRH